MCNTVIQVDSLWKKYRLGVVGTGTLRHDLSRWLHRITGRQDPCAPIGTSATPGIKLPRADDISERREAISPVSSLAENEIWALRDVSLDVKEGEILGIIGRNGAGKSTLLKILSRVTAPTAGELRVRGRIASLLEVGTGFHPELTGRENIFLNGTILGMTKSEIKRKLDEIVAFAEVNRYIDTPVKRYSSGMHVRLAFAVAAHLDPEILIVDEVLAVGDIQFQQKCLGKMSRVAQGGRTVLFVSHNLVAVKKLCHKGVWIDNGHVRRVSNVSDIVDAYTNAAHNAPGDQRFSVSQTSGDGQISLVSYRITNASGTSAPPPGTLEDILLQITIRATSEIAHPAVGISIQNEHGVLMTSINTVENATEFPPIPGGDSIVTIHIRRTSLLPGQYIASFWVMNPQGHIYVMAEHSIIFSIAQVPLYGTCHVDHRWGCVFSDISFYLTPFSSCIS